MKMKQMMSGFAHVMSGAKVCWMKDDDNKSMSVLAIIPESATKISDGNRSIRLADRAKRMAFKEAKRVGRIMSVGVFMGGNGDGSVSATGIAEIPWSKDAETRLVSSGMQRI